MYAIFDKIPTQTININFIGHLKMKWISTIILMAFLTSCKSEKQILCDDPVYTSGNIKIISRQCFLFGERCIALIEMYDLITNHKFIATARILDDQIIFTSLHVK